MRKAEAEGRFGSAASAEGYAIPMGALSEYYPHNRVRLWVGPTKGEEAPAFGGPASGPAHSGRGRFLYFS